ncbi:c-type cytochrome [Prosthecobacter sp.]|uniref:c-type cytochrome n=1 Tax=Prosthecobacter sp. TaxID=1965333 RepID=UPI003782DE0D
MIRRLPALLLLLFLAACKPQMGEQAKHEAYTPSDFFADGAAMRPLPAHTVARGQLSATDAYHTGLRGDGQLTTEFPDPVTPALLTRGREMFEVFCSVCHGFTGAGDGMIVQRGFPAPPTFHSDRLRQAPVGHFVNVIHSGYGVMYRYASRVPAADRWAIVAYIRALQLSQHATLADVPDADRSRLAAPPQKGGGL